MIVLLIKITLLFAMALAAQPLLRRSTAALRHLVCASALAGALLLPLTLLSPSQAGLVHLGALSVAADSQAALQTTAHWPLLRLIEILWATGSVWLLLRIALGYFTLARLLRKATRLEDSRSVPAFFADISVPVVSGLLRPVILLPLAAEQWPLSQRNAALNHELQHVGRYDLWTMLSGHLACAVYWFHPLAWAVARRLRDEQESACDDAVLTSGFDPASYAEALVAAARHLTSTRLIGCHMLTTNSLKSRIARLFDSGLARIPSRAGLRAAAAVSVLSIGMVGILAANDRVYKMGDGITPPRVLSKIDPDYTEEARAAKVAGTVVLSLVIGADGLAKDINVVGSLGSGLDEKAVEAVQKWLFQPGLKEGEPVQVMATIEINFRLK